MFKRIMAILLVAVAAVAMTACVPKVDSEGQKIVLITDKGDIDDKSFNQGSYDGVKAFGDKYKVEYAYLKPREATNEAYIAAIEQAIANGATIIVTPDSCLKDLSTLFKQCILMLNLSFLMEVRLMPKAEHLKRTFILCSMPKNKLGS